MLGRGVYNIFIGTLIVMLVAGGMAFATNYTMTQGAGTTFGSIVVSTVNYPQMLNCDPTTPTQCAAVSNTGAMSVTASPMPPPIRAPTPRPMWPLRHRPVRCSW